MSDELDRMTERLADHIVRPFLDRLVAEGILPQPQEMLVTWSPPPAVFEESSPVIRCQEVVEQTFIGQPTDLTCGDPLLTADRPVIVPGKKGQE